MKYLSLLIILLIVIAAGIFFINRSPKSSPARSSQTSQTSPTHASYHISNGPVPEIPFSLSPGYTIHTFADGLGNPRDLQFTPGGTLLVSNPNNNDVVALPDANHDGQADTEKVVVNNVPHAHGLAFYQGRLYVAGVTEVDKYDWDEPTLTASNKTKLFSLPPNNDHNARTIIFNSQGQMLISVGSTCNICRETPQQGGSIWVSDANGTNPHIFASGLRNAPFLATNPKTNEIWVTEMGRDYLGEDTPPDEINILQQGKDYGFPNCYGNRVHDDNFDKQNHSCTNTEPPIYEIPAHSAPLGLAFINSTQFPGSWQGDLLVAYHGSWNRTLPAGFKVVHLKVNGNTITGSDDFLTGFLAGNTNDSSLGRPVDMTFDTQGNLYLSDDKAGNVYIIQKE